MKRKHFITGAIAAVSAIAVPLIYRSGSSRDRDPLLTPDMLGRFCDEDTIRKIGNEYLALAPSETKKDSLRNLILSDYKGRHLAASDSSTVMRWVTNRIQDDFRKGKTLTLDGWILSETEARQCALFSIVKK